MAAEDKLMTVEKNRLLYDDETLDDVRDGLTKQGIPPKPTEIKQAVKTSATVYEIRTAVTYWFGGRMDHRGSDRVWANCTAFDSGQWELGENDTIEVSESEVTN